MNLFFENSKIDTTLINFFINKMKNFLTSKDTDLIILDKLEDRDLLVFCLINKTANNLCNNDIFWENRIRKYFPHAEKYKTENRTNRNFYLSLVKYISLAEEIRETKASVYVRRNKTMYFAIINNDKNIVEYLVSIGASLDYGLRIAEEKNIKMIDYFISKGANNINRLQAQGRVFRKVF